MGVMRVFFCCCCLLIFANGDDFDRQIAEHVEPVNGKASKIELFPSVSTPTSRGKTRMPRTLFKKLHSGAAFLAGLKLGTILSKKGFELSHGKIESTHSFQVFGKSVNSAMSLAYGNAEQLLPLVDEQGGDSLKRTTSKKDKKKVFRVIVIENPSNETMEIFHALPVQSDEEKTIQNATDAKTVLLYQDPVEANPGGGETETNFTEHNNRVKKINERISRRQNSKILV